MAKSKAKKKAPQELAVGTMFTPKDIPTMLANVNAKIEALKGGCEGDASTKGVDLPGFGQLKDIEDLSKLIQASSSVSGRERTYNEEAKSMEIEGVIPEFKIADYSPDTWRIDIKRRYQEVAFAGQLETLNKIKETLESNQSKEMKFHNDMEKISVLMEQF